jgi:hypothetical protein
MNSRIPRTMGPPTVRSALFRHEDGGGIALKIPVYSVLPGQLATPAPGGGVMLNLATNVSGEDDDFLKRNEDGSFSIRLAS